MENEESQKVEFLLQRSIELNNQLIGNYRALDTKSAILLGLLGIILLSALSGLQFMQLSDLFLLITIASSLVSVVVLVISIRLNALHTDSDLGKILELLEKDNLLEVSKQIFSNYQDAAKDNYRIVKKKARNIRTVYPLFVLSIITFTLAEILRRLNE